MMIAADETKADALEKKGLDLAERYWAYQGVRRGQKLEILPVQDSKMQQWVSVARLLVKVGRFVAVMALLFTAGT